MLKFASKLSDDYEYAIVWWGQSNARAQGLRDTEGFVADPMLKLPTPGMRLTITNVGTASGVGTVTVTETLTANQWVGYRLRFGTTYPGTSIAHNSKGYGTVTANAANTLTVAWATTSSSSTYAIAAAPGTVAPTVTFTHATDTVSATGHPFNTGDQVRLSGGTLPAELATNTTYYVIKVDANTFKLASSIANAVLATALDFTDDGSGAITCTLYAWGGYLLADDASRQYEAVRVLHPYTPEAPGASPAGVPVVPGYNFPATVSTYDKCGIFLPYSWDEGIEGYRTAGTATAASTNTLTDGAATWTIDEFAGAVVIAGNSYGYVQSNNGTVLTLTAAWVGGIPSSTAAYQILVPHYFDSPNRHLPGFRYPSNALQPGGDAATTERATGKIYGRGNSTTVGIFNTVSATTYNWTYQFGAMLPCAWRLANKLGKRIHVIPLGVNSSRLTQAPGPLVQGYQGTIGWFHPTKSDWTPSKTNSLAARLEQMVTVMAPGALSAEGNTKPLKIIGIVGFQGESDSLSASGRTVYGDTLATFYTWLRGLIKTAGLSPYATGVEVPVVHASLPKDRWENVAYDSVVKAYFGADYGIDVDGVVNTAIAEVTAKDGYAATFSTDASTARYDVIHFNGAGEERNGRLAADVLAEVVNLAVGNGSDDGAVAICNLALSNIGESAKVTSIDPSDGSAQATHCARFYPIARDSLLEMKAWSFASRRATLTQVEHTLKEWDYAYALPSDVLSVTAVQGAENADDYAFGAGTPMLQWPGSVTGQYTPQPYVIEQDADGAKVLYTDVQNAVIRYTARVTDTLHYPSAFKVALSWHLAGMLAGPIVKGDMGAAEAKRCQAMMAQFMSKADTNDAVQRKINPEHYVPWMQNR